MQEVKISILTATARDLGMLGYQIELLNLQTFRDFEWIFVDDRYPALDFSAAQFPVTYMAPVEIKSYYAPAVALNDGIARSRGELLYFMSDYIIPHADCLRAHWDIYQRYSRAMISGRCWELNITPDEFMQPNKAFHYNDYRLSLFENSYFKWDRLENSLYRSERSGVQNWWTGRNDSCPMEAMLECNGMDEQTDGGRGYVDDDMAQRLVILGLEYLITLDALCFQFPHQLEGGKPKLRTDEEQHQLFKVGVIQERMKKKIYKANPHRDLRVEREVWLKSRS